MSLPTDAGRCVVPRFSPPFSFEPQAGWQWSIAREDDQLLLETGTDLAAKIEFYRFGGSAVTDLCAVPPQTVPISDVNELWTHLDSLERLQVFAIGRSVAINPAWQFDIQALEHPECSGTPSDQARLPLWTIAGAQTRFETMNAGDLMRAYFILVGEDIVVMTAKASGSADQRDFEFAAEEIFSSLSFDVESTDAAGAPPAGPPFPLPVRATRVYDYAGIFSDQAEAAAEGTISGIESATNSLVVVFTQYKPGSTTDSTEQDARALTDEWGIGGAFGEGLVILWNVTRVPCDSETPGNGQVQLYAGQGFASNYLSNSERQAIFDNDMLPLLVQCDMDGALRVALDRITASAQ